MTDAKPVDPLRELIADWKQFTGGDVIALTVRAMGEEAESVLTAHDAQQQSRWMALGAERMREACFLVAKDSVFLDEKTPCDEGQREFRKKYGVVEAYEAIANLPLPDSGEQALARLRDEVRAAFHNFLDSIPFDSNMTYEAQEAYDALEALLGGTDERP